MQGGNNFNGGEIKEKDNNYKQEEFNQVTYTGYNNQNRDRNYK